ncbi:MAG: methylated-DNA--[protein]-cysteine S-methyltransferase [Bacillota bacterium]|nr:methylated-DNA--[protein]-cysteine S-methyltransferase [Candidatus Fermentithermobacillaceae bacterium]
MKTTVIRETPVGPLTIAARHGSICSLQFGEKPVVNVAEPTDSEDEVILGRAVAEVEAYFRGELREFTVPVTLEGPPFHSKVWRYLAKIPFGRVESYGQIALNLGRPGAARAVGNACAANPVVLIVPCHRVLATSGLGGFGGGLPAKEWLLRHEGCDIFDGFRGGLARHSWKLSHSG